MSQKIIHETAPGPLFTFSYLPTLLYPLAGAAIFIPVDVIYALDVLYSFSLWNLWGFLVGLIFDLLLIYTIRNLWLLPIHRASFFQDYFTVSRRRAAEKLQYADVSHVEKHKSRTLTNIGTLVRISVKGRDSALTIPLNPRNRKLKTDLYTWLTERTGQAN
ncbi:MAG: hypothetical protein ABSB56_03730 [Nitrososphaerales archaeon]